MGVAVVGCVLFLLSRNSFACREECLSTNETHEITCVHGSSLLSSKYSQLPLATRRKFKQLSKRVGTTSTSWWWPFPNETPWAENMTAAVTCHTSIFAPGIGRCPSSCPFQTPDVQVNCHWRCVRKEDCGKTDIVNSIADEEISMCRVCKSRGCDVCAPGADACIKCMHGYNNVKGICLSKMRRVWWWASRVFAVVVGCVVLYYVSLLCRPLKNKSGLERAIAHRSKASLRDHEYDRWYSLRANLRSVPANGRAPIGGPGLMLFFNFQFGVLVWIVLALVTWVILGTIGNSALLSLGTINAEDPQEMCQAVHWGRAMREQLRIMKMAFMVCLYVATTIGIIMFGASQYHNFHAVDDRTATMMDYALMCKGFPQESGESVEADVLSYLEKATSLKLVGVSICWDYADHKETVQELATCMVRALENRLLRSRDPHNEHYDDHIQEPLDSVPSSTASVDLFDRLKNWFDLLWSRRACCLCKPCVKAIDSLLGVGTSPLLMEFYPQKLSSLDADSAARCDGDEGKDDKEGRKQLMALINSIKTSGRAVAVFQSELDRDAAMEALANEAVQRYRGTHVIRPSKTFAEPESMVWDSYTALENKIWLRTFLSSVLVFGAVIVWAIFVYAPSAYYQILPYIANAEDPPFVARFMFMILVVLGNQIMYCLCSSISESIGFKTFESQQAAYVALYTCAVLTNTILDIAIVVIMCYWGMKSKGVRTDEGILLSDLPDMAALFESQPMMQVFGSMLFQYSFPSCFLTPFILECAAVHIFLPHLAERLVGSRRVSETNAEQLLHPCPMDLIRYADLLINLCLTAMCFITSSGWVLRTLAGLLSGHLFIYVYDRWRVLRKTETFYYALYSVESLAQKMLALPCAILAAAIAFTVLGFDGKHVQGANVFGWMAFVFCAHLLLHVLAIELLVPRVGYYKKKTQTATPYEEAATYYPRSWFSENPVHCLRSAFVHQHSPPCVYHGKEKRFFKGKAARPLLRAASSSLEEIHGRTT